MWCKEEHTKSIQLKVSGFGWSMPITNEEWGCCTIRHNHKEDLLFIVCQLRKIRINFFIVSNYS